MNLHFRSPLQTLCLRALSGLLVLSVTVACAPAVDDAGTPRRIARQVDELMNSVALNELAEQLLPRCPAAAKRLRESGHSALMSASVPRPPETANHTAKTGQVILVIRERLLQQGP